jgi:hypothetical protein
MMSQKISNVLSIQLHSSHSFHHPNAIWCNGSTHSSPKHISRSVCQNVVTILYYARVVDSTMLVTLVTLAGTPSKAITKTLEHVNQFLNYDSPHSNAIIRY